MFCRVKNWYKQWKKFWFLVGEKYFRKIRTSVGTSGIVLEKIEKMRRTRVFYVYTCARGKWIGSFKIFRKKQRREACELCFVSGKWGFLWEKYYSFSRSGFFGFARKVYTNFAKQVHRMIFYCKNYEKFLKISIFGIFILP